MTYNRTGLLTALLALAAVAGLSLPARGQDKLDSMVAYSLKKIPPALEKAEKLLLQGDLPNAKVYLEKAQGEWDMIHRDFKSKFDPQHPDMVAVQKQLEAVKAKVAGAANEGQAAAAGPGPSDAGAATTALPSTMVYEMKQFGPALDRVGQYVEAKELGEARAILDKAQHEWDTKKGWNKGKFDPRHPDVQALDARFAAAQNSVAQLAGKASTAAEDLPAVLEAVSENAKSLYATYDRARSAIRDLSSLRSDFDRGSEQDMGKLQARMDAVRVLVERVNASLPDALAAAQAFRKQFPDFNALEKLVGKGAPVSGREAGQQVERLEAFPREWLREVSFVAKEALDEAERNIKQYGLDRLGNLQGKNRALQTSAADAAEHWVLDYSSIMLDMIDTLLPELAQEAQAALPALASARQDFLKRATGMRASIKQVAKAVSRVRKKIVSADLRRLKEARFPKSKHTGGEWAAAEKTIAGAWAKKIKDKKLVRVSIYSPWEVRREARWVNRRWVVDTYRYIGANCLAKLSSGKYRVFRMMFRNTKQAKGNWSPLVQHSVGHVYDILKENINK